MNPLSDARRGRTKQKRQAAKDDAAQDIWFRKSQLGYRCFVEYYAMQTDLWKDSTDLRNEGISTSRDNSDSTIRSYSVVKPNVKNSSMGLSRAAKRRKKKKGIAVPLVTNVGNETAPTATGDIQQTNEVSDTKHPLLLAWRSFAETRPSHYSTRATLMLLFETLSRPLPLTFRIRSTADPSRTSLFREEISSYNKRDRTASVQFMHSLDGSNQWNQRVCQLEYFQADCSKHSLMDEKFKESLLRYSQNGTVARQELGSMLPVAALQAFGCFDLEERPAKTWRPLCVLDMCASPGSKTLQALEALLEQKRKFHLVANDILPSRLEALKHAVQRSGISESLLQHLTYTCQDASKFELCHVNPVRKENPKSDVLHFDVILCDVPCSGDGTCRKDPHILPNWKPSIGNLLHATQLSILQRALQLLQPNGCVAYSTCTMNPIENEAVVAAAINQYNTGSNSPFFVELMECPKFANIQLHDGIADWKVADYQHHCTPTGPCGDDDDEDDSKSYHMQWFDSFEDALRSKQNHAAPHQWTPTLWPPSTLSQVRLSKCKRLWPSHQNTGGFFVALIGKVQHPSEIKAFQL
jgi:16S rRNA C967 or C1407 C5-methylase (RsmB/RsmF family)